MQTCDASFPFRRGPAPLVLIAAVLAIFFVGAILLLVTAWSLFREPVAKIIEIMRHDVGTFFDADLLHIFLRHVVARGVSTVPSHVDDDSPENAVDDDRPMNAKERWALKERQDRERRRERKDS